MGRGLTGEDALGAAIKYTKNSLVGVGALKGKNCTISSVVPTDEGNLVTFSWYLDNGTSKSETILVKNGEDGYTPQKDVDYFDGEKGDQGDPGVGIQSITKESTSGLVDTYLILFADGTTTTFNVVNGANVTKTSQLENDSEFITNATIGLINYYLKDEVYSKSKIDELLRNIGAGLSVKIVPELPTEEISGTTIYLINTSGSNYNQYMYIDDSWASLGSTSVDLSSYYNKSQIDTMLLGYVTSSILLTQLLSYTKTADMAKVARTNSYNDLDDLPEIPDVSGIKPYVDVVQDSSNTAPTSKVVYDAVQAINESLDEKADADDVPEIDDTSTTDTDKVWSAKKVNDSLVDKHFPSGTEFYLDEQNGEFGFNTSKERGADTFFPFKAGSKYEFFATSVDSFTTEEDMYNAIAVLGRNSAPTLKVGGVTITATETVYYGGYVSRFEKIDYIPKGTTIVTQGRGFIVHEVPPIDSEKALYMGSYTYTNKETTIPLEKGEYILTVIAYSSNGATYVRNNYIKATAFEGGTDTVIDSKDGNCYALDVHRITMDTSGSIEFKVANISVVKVG